MYSNSCFSLLVFKRYYKRAANASIPFHMALHALGNHYLYHPTEANHTLARQYYLRVSVVRYLLSKTIASLKDSQFINT